MRYLLSAIAVVAFIGGAAAEDAVKASNATCCCGKPIDAKVEAVSVKAGDKTGAIAVCSAECQAKVKAMKGEEAVKAAEAHNKGWTLVK